MEMCVAEVFADPGPGRAYLEVNGKERSGVKISYYHVDYRSVTQLSASSSAGTKFLSHLKINELPIDFGKLDIPVEFTWRNLEVRAVLERGARPLERGAGPKFAFELHANLSDWSGALSFSTLTDTVEAAVAAGSYSKLANVVVSRSGYFSIVFRAASGTLARNVRSRMHLLAICRDEVEQRLAHREGLTLTFNFAPQVKVACQQYLLYFADFLMDVGINVNTSIHEDAGHVLFSVVPVDAEAALDAIREALAVYLSLPLAEIAPDTSSDIEVMKLSANIHHLKGQLELATALLATQSNTIEAQRFALDLQQRLLRPELTVRASDREELFGGMVAVKPYEGKGFDINLAEVFRRLRKRFRR